jgi:hypothetical protein
MLKEVYVGRHVMCSLFLSENVLTDFSKMSQF